MPVPQSAYRRDHSTETAVLKVQNDLMLAADGQLSALCLLDLTAAFNTVDHELLLLRLERQFGLRGAVLQWFRSYLTAWAQIPGGTGGHVPPTFLGRGTVLVLSPHFCIQNNYNIQFNISCMPYSAYY